jgi:hypothetical protein
MCIIIKCMPSHMQCFQNVQTYFATPVSYACKMLIKCCRIQSLTQTKWTWSKCYKTFLVCPLWRSAQIS